MCIYVCVWGSRTSACRSTFVEVSGTCRSPGLASQLAPGILFPPSVLWWLPCPSGFDVGSGALTFIFVQHALHPLSHLTSLGKIFKSSFLSTKCRMESLGTLISLGALLWTFRRVSVSPPSPTCLIIHCYTGRFHHDCFISHTDQEAKVPLLTLTRVGDGWSLTFYL